jgi:DnaJ-domain-containing protein 1
VSKWKSGFVYTADEIESLLKEIDGIIRKADPEGGKEGYQGSARAELRGLRASAEIEMAQDNTAAMTKRINDLKLKVEGFRKVAASAFAAAPDTLTGVAKELVGDQAEGAKARKAYLEEREQLKALYGKLIREHEKFGDRKMSDEDSREYEDIRKLINAAADIANAKKDESDLQDIASAMAMVNRSFDRLEVLMQGGPQVDRGKLGALQSDWTKGVAAFEAKGRELIKAVGVLADEEPEESGYRKAADEVQKLVDEALRYFRKFDFTKETEVLKDGDPSKALARKRARETALAKVRDAMGYLNTSPVMKKLVGNPFGVSAVGTALFRHMRRIELEVMRGV